MILRCSIIAALATGAASCTSSPDVTDGSAVPSVEQSAGLKPQELAFGECGLFLWTASEPRRFVFFSKAGSNQALVDVAGEALTFAQTNSDGDVFGQFTTQMNYVNNKNDVELALVFSPGAIIDRGQRTEAARLTITDKEGWETIVPTAGVRACRVDG